MVQTQNFPQAGIATRRWGCDCFGVPQKRRTDCCLTLPEDKIKRPDLAIYSQEEVIGRGEDPIWNNPDIVVINSPYARLNEETQVTVRNISRDAAAVGAQVHLFHSRFGIGFDRRHIGSQTVSLAPSTGATLSFPLSRAVVVGDPKIGVHVEIEHAHDQNLINNCGSQVLAASLTSVSGRTFDLPIPILNRSSFARRITLRIVAWDLVAAIVPVSRSFGPNEESVVSLHIEVPASARPTPDEGTRRLATVIATADDGSLVGGVSQYIGVDA